MTALYQLRAATAAEIETIRTIERIAAQRFAGSMFAWVMADEPTDAAALLERLRDERLIVADHQGVAVAFVIFSAVDGSAYIEEVDVLPDHAGHRLAARLIDAVAARAAAAGLSRLTLSTFRDIVWNAPYYRRLGFVDIPMMDLTPGLAAIREHHRQKGLEDDVRVFMRRPVHATET